VSDAPLSHEDIQIKWAASWPGDKEFDGKPFGEGQCVACGFLSRRRLGPGSHRAEEATLDDRLGGNYFFVADGSPAVPWCFVRAANLVAETQAFHDWTVEQQRNTTPPIPPGSITNSREPHVPGHITHREADAKMVVSKQRKCLEWFPYREDQSPAEHRDERNMLRLEQERRDLARKLADMDRDTQLRLAELRNQADDIAAKRERFTFKAFLIIAIVGVVLALVTIGVSLYPDEVRAWLSGL
jgi:hypothetical protein